VRLPGDHPAGVGTHREKCDAVAASGYEGFVIR
jgi:hypothetical protein